jgi:hypothetical protein
MWQGLNPLINIHLYTKFTLVRLNRGVSWRADVGILCPPLSKLLSKGQGCCDGRQSEQFFLMEPSVSA